jgi:hypothetical protein
MFPRRRHGGSGARARSPGRNEGGPGTPKDMPDERETADQRRRPVRDDDRDDPVYGRDSPSESGGDQFAPPDEPTHEGPPRDQRSREPLGPVTPDPERPLGDTAEAHDEITPHDLPPGHPGRAEAEREADEDPDHVTRGNR